MPPKTSSGPSSTSVCPIKMDIPIVSRPNPPNSGCRIADVPSLRESSTPDSSFECSSEADSRTVPTTVKRLKLLDLDTCEQSSTSSTGSPSPASIVSHDDSIENAGTSSSSISAVLSPQQEPQSKKPLPRFIMAKINKYLKQVPEPKKGEKGAIALVYSDGSIRSLSDTERANAMAAKERRSVSKNGPSATIRDSAAPSSASQPDVVVDQTVQEKKTGQTETIIPQAGIKRSAEKTPSQGQNVEQSLPVAKMQENLPRRPRQAAKKVTKNRDIVYDLEDYMPLWDLAKSLRSKGYSLDKTDGDRNLPAPVSSTLPDVQSSPQLLEGGPKEIDGILSYYDDKELAGVKPNGGCARATPRRIWSGEEKKLHIRFCTGISDQEVALTPEMKIRWDQKKKRANQLGINVNPLSLRVARSGLHGSGLYALEPIAAGDIIIQYTGKVIRSGAMPDVKEKQYEKKGLGDYLFRIDDDWVIDATNYGSKARYINHSCTPNCESQVVKADGEKKVIILSKKRINIGEELTIDYKFPFEDKKIACRCGSLACRRFIN